MWMAYRDDKSILTVEVDETVYFYNGFAWFACNDVDFKIPINNVVEIGKTEK